MNSKALINEHVKKIQQMLGGLTKYEKEAILKELVKLYPGITYSDPEIKESVLKEASIPNTVTINIGTLVKKVQVMSGFKSSVEKEITQALLDALSKSANID